MCWGGAGSAPEAQQVTQALQQLLAPGPGCVPLLLPQPTPERPQTGGTLSWGEPPSSAAARPQGGTPPAAPPALPPQWTPLDGSSIFDGGQTLACSASAGGGIDFARAGGEVLMPKTAVIAWLQRWEPALRALLAE